ncbi:MAG: hypothetical protein HY736_27750 [Verrucomicrobia bacterium]|nr:hypothetical protein [Verrucomicrobiota bacterium]
MGIIESESNEAMVIRGLGGTETIPRHQIEAYEPLGVSLMPEGLEASLTEPKMADLLAYLRSTRD